MDQDQHSNLTMKDKTGTLLSRDVPTSHIVYKPAGISERLWPAKIKLAQTLQGCFWANLMRSDPTPGFWRRLDQKL